MALTHKTHSNHTQILPIDEINRDYLVLNNLFALSNAEIRVYYNDDLDIAEKYTRNLAQAGEMFTRMRNWKLSRAKHLTDLMIPFPCLTNDEKSLFFMNQNEYEKNFRVAWKFDVNLQENLRLWKINKNVGLDSYYHVNDQYYETNKIRRVTGIIARALLQEVDIIVNLKHDFLVIKAEHGVVLISPTKKRFVDKTKYIYTTLNLV